MLNKSISIIIRTKNSEKTIFNCLEKIYTQTIQPFEIIIVDSGSTDNTINIVQEFNCKIISYPYSEFNYSKALNIGITKAKGIYIMPVSSHVILENEKTIEYMLYYLSSNPSICTVSTFRKTRNVAQIKQLEKVNWSVFTKYNFKGMAMFNPCSMFKKELWKEYSFNENMPTAEDCDWIKYYMNKYNYGAIVLHNPYVLYENPYNSMQKEHREIITVARYVYPPILETKNILKLITLEAGHAIFDGDFYRLFWKYKLAYLLIKERLGFKMKINSNYHKKLE